MAAALAVAACQATSERGAAGSSAAGATAMAETAATPMATQPAQPDPQMQAVLDELAALGGRPIETLSAEQARLQPTAADAVESLLRKRGMSTAPIPVGNVEDRTIRGPAGPIPVRIYTPVGTGPFPVIVYYHGGGWVIGDLDSYDRSARALAAAWAQAIVVSVHYRQGPEHRFPAAHEDAYAAYRWTRDNARSLNGDPARIVVAGEGAGGNLAAAVTLMAREQGDPLPVHQVLIYPIAGHDFGTPSYIENADAEPLDRTTMMWFFDNYLTEPADAESPLISLVRASSLSGLPPTTVITAEIDPLRSEGLAYAERLERAGVKVIHRPYEGVTHEFFGMGAIVDTARDANAGVALDLLKTFGDIRS